MDSRVRWEPLFGDSFLTGLGLRDQALVTDRVERWRAEATGSPVEAFNFGHLPAASATLPLSLQIDLVGVGRWRATLRRAGPFDIEFEIPVGKEQPSMEGYIPLTITPLVPGGRLRMPLRMDRVGFAERPDGAL